MQDSLPAGGLRLCREGIEPSGSLRKGSGYISILLSRTSPVAMGVETNPHRSGRIMPASDQASLLPFALPSVQRKKVTAAFDGGRISSDDGVMLLALAERRIGIADTLAAQIADRRDPARVTPLLADILRARSLAIACAYEDADDLDHLRRDPALELACGRLPD